MNADWLIYLAGISALFASRAFLPALMAGLALRYPGQLGLVSVEVTGDLAAWISSDAGLTILAVLSALEIAADKNPDIRDFMNQINIWVKTAVAAATNYQVIQTEQGRIIFGVEETTGATATTLAVASAAPVAGIGYIRNRALEFLRDIDPDNDIGLVSLASWMEDIWVMLGVIFLVLLPLIALVVIVIALILVGAFDLYQRAREEKKKVPCGSCGEKIQPFALKCANCSARVERPCGVGALGQPIMDFPSDHAMHALRLMGVKRCSSCGGRLKKRGLPQTCSECSARVPDTDENIRRYAEAMQARLGRALIVTFLVGLIPVVGAIFSVVYSRVVLVKPWRQYLSRGRGIMLKWMARLAVLILIILQPFPLIGYVSGPLIALISFTVWKSGFQKTYGLI